MSVLVKICGITTARDARRAFEAGADWIGLNLVAGPRKITFDNMCHIVESARHRAKCVLLVNEKSLDPSDFDVLCVLGVFRLQLYGSIPDLLEVSKAFETIAVHHIADTTSLLKIDEYSDVGTNWRPTYALLDAAVDPKDGQLGGTGRLANWSAIELARQEGCFANWPPVILAGGLTPDNVEEAIQRVRPWGVDVSSGVESEPGVKDPKKMEQFVKRAKNAG